MPDDTQASMIKGPTILTFSGNYFNFLRPETSLVFIEDIAQGLSNTCRFAGQCPRFYSVAQHSVHASCMVPKEFAYEALMHDASEAFICDMVKPLKEMLPEYQEIEKRVERAISLRFGVPEKMSPEVKAADIRMLATEQRQLYQNKDEWTWTQGVEPYAITLPYWSPHEAYHQFIDRYYELTEQHGKRTKRYANIRNPEDAIYD